tara:strand:- start:3352 stop:4431 length:1080 start_codon:yes stop_codon:yes gene_type:complete
MAENLDMETYYRRYKQNIGRELFLETPNPLIGKVPNIGPEDLSMVAKTGSAQAKGLISTTAGTFPAIVGIFAGLGNMMTDDPEKKGNWEQFAAGYDTIPFTPEKIKQQFTDWGWDPKSENELEQMIINLNETMGDVVAPGKIYGAETLVKGAKGIASGAKSVTKSGAKLVTDGFKSANKFIKETKYGTVDTGIIKDNPEFAAFFQRSKIVDPKGNPIILYHGSSSVFDEFKTPIQLDPKDRRSAIWLTSSKAKADGYAGEGQFNSRINNKNRPSDGHKKKSDYHGNITPVYVRMENPYYGSLGSGTDNINELKAMGHDGIIANYRVGGGAGEDPLIYLAFDNAQITPALSVKNSIREVK